MLLINKYVQFLMTPEQKARYEKFEMLRAEAGRVEKMCGVNSYEMRKKRNEINDALREYIQIQSK